MKASIFINLPVSDLKKSMDFYSAIGFVNNPMFTDETAACMVLNENIYVMIMVHDRFRDFTKKPIPNTKEQVAVINSLSLSSVEEVNRILDKAKSSGGNELGELRDYGFMQMRSFEDLDGHYWEVFFMDVSKVPAEGPQE